MRSSFEKADAGFEKDAQSRRQFHLSFAFHRESFCDDAVSHRPKTSFDLTYTFAADFELPADLRIREVLRAAIKYLALPLCEGSRAKKAYDLRGVGLFGSRNDHASLAHF